MINRQCHESYLKMKLPFYTIIVPHLRRHSRIIKKTCSYAFLNFADIYTCVLGILGAVSSTITT